jgi:hypothetical protein
MIGLNPGRVAIFRCRLEERRDLLCAHLQTAAEYMSSSPVENKPPAPTPTAKDANDLAYQLQSIRITRGATPVSHRTTPT